MMRQCEKCGAKIDDSAVFCSGCGARLSEQAAASPTVEEGQKHCSQCGAELGADSKFCKQCGARTEMAAASENALIQSDPEQSGTAAVPEVEQRNSSAEVSMPPRLEKAGRKASPLKRKDVPAEEKAKRRKGKWIALLLLGVLLVGFGGTGGYFVARKGWDVRLWFAKPEETAGKETIQEEPDAVLPTVPPDDKDDKEKDPEQEKTPEQEREEYLSKLPAGLQDGLLLVGLDSRDVFPFRFRQGETWSGFDVDLCQAIADFLVVDVTFVAIGEIGMADMLGTGLVDCIVPGALYTEDWETAFSLSEPYLQDPLCLFAPENVEENGLLTNPNAKIAMSGQLYQSDKWILLRTIYGLDNKNILVCDDDEAALQAAANGQANAALVSQAAGRYWNRALSLRLYPLSVNLEHTEFLVFLCSKTQPELSELVSECLRMLETQGKLEELKNKWFGPSVPGGDLDE